MQYLIQQTSLKGSTNGTTSYLFSMRQNGSAVTPLIPKYGVLATALHFFTREEAEIEREKLLREWSETDKQYARLDVVPAAEELVL